MKNIFLLVVLAFISFKAFSQEMTPIFDINQGRCWAQEVGKSSWKVASFNQQNTFEISKTAFSDELLQKLEERLNEDGVKFPHVENVSGSLFCNSSLSFVMAHVKGDPFSLCVLVSLSGHNEIVEMKINSLNQNSCRDDYFGERPLKLFINLYPTSNEQKSMIARYLSEDFRYRQVITAVNAEGKGDYLEVTLKENWKYQEERIKLGLLKDPFLTPFVQSISYSFYVLNRGAELPLFD